MAEAWPRTAPQPTASNSEFIVTFALVIGAILLFGAFDVWLARIDSRESELHAVNLYTDGRAQLAAGHPREAADLFSSAVALARSNVRYSTALAEALLASGRYDEAETVLRSLLARAESDGEANLVMARVLEREGRREEAVRYFHRAIYGRWEGNAEARRLDARMELVDLLVRTGAKQELLAELLPLADTAIGHERVRRRVAHLFTTAGSPERSAVLFRAMVRVDPKDGDAWLGLGEATLALGNFATARADLVEAARQLGPDSARVAGPLAVADSALALDPTPRRLDAHERYERSLRLLALTLDAVARCAPEPPGGVIDSARVLLAPPPPPVEAPRGRGRRAAARAESEAAPSEGDRTEAMLGVAGSLWDARGARCPVPAVPGLPSTLELVLAKLSG